MSQNDRLLANLQTNGSINPMEAWSELGIYRLASRALELKQDGHNIITNRVEVNNRFGEVCRVASYSLI